LRSQAPIAKPPALSHRDKQRPVALPLESAELAFGDFDTEESGSERLYLAPASDALPETKNALEPSSRERYEIMERETGFEPANLSLGSC
jgi:hypothetical protein